MSTDLSPEKARRLEQENIRLRRAVEELSILNEIATAISSSLSIDQIIELIVNKCVKHLKVEQAAVMLLEQQQQDQMFKTMVRRTDRSGSNILPFRLDAELTGWMLKHERPLLINDFQQDERFSRLVGDDFPIHSLMSVPLL
ncbi:MAG: GAF domain-containing protein, partial [Calditrichaeota bacterium]|nr:GAF domain-containing protein [Calditrichota bacterium]